ncbi:MAG: IS66 family insertion sequence element accessory protein TnpB [Tissierellia bacterium]|nr:IS66 family insertion sequence element accessory protein TnpB [Tissierellia bacterium]MDD4089044.1 IS66 family insertion sequence element accessory protein TnpB [Tissierellia bacterium]
MNMKKISHEMNLQKWTQIVEECRNSGKTVVKWCDENDINIKTYYYWQRKVLKAVCNELSIANNNVETSPAFAEVILPGMRKSEVAITLNLNNISLQIHNGANESVISQTLKVLRNLC